MLFNLLEVLTEIPDASLSQATIPAIITLIYIIIGSCPYNIQLLEAGGSCYCDLVLYK